jgi:hypothetical protein
MGGFKQVLDEYAPPGMVILASDQQTVVLWKGKAQVFDLEELTDIYIAAFDEVMGYTGNRLREEQE